MSRSDEVFRRSIQIAKLRDEGIVQQNEDKCTAEDEVTLTMIKQSKDNIVHCVNCKRSYQNKYLYRHKRICTSSSSVSRPLTCQLTTADEKPEFIQLLSSFQKTTAAISVVLTQLCAQSAVTKWPSPSGRHQVAVAKWPSPIGRHQVAVTNRPSPMAEGAGRSRQGR